MLANRIRRAAELLSRGRVIRRRITVRGQVIPLYVSPDAQLKYLKPSFDRDLIELAERYVERDHVVWDVGANVGTFALAAAHIAVAGTTVAIEPDPFLVELLRRSQGLAETERGALRVLGCAVSELNGVATLDIAGRGRACNALRIAGGRSQMGGVRHSLDVPTLTLDALGDFLPAPNFIKIDVEGAELLVLRGAMRVLERYRPLVYLEVDSDRAGEVARRMAAASYLCFDAQGAPLPEPAFNTLFVPRERLRGREGDALAFTSLSRPAIAADA